MFASLWNAAALHSGIEIVARDSAGQCLAATRLASAATDHRGAAAPYQRGARNWCRVGEARQGGRVPFVIRARGETRRNLRDLPLVGQDERAVRYDCPRLRWRELRRID